MLIVMYLASPLLTGTNQALTPAWARGPLWMMHAWRIASIDRSLLRGARSGPAAVWLPGHRMEFAEQGHDPMIGALQQFIWWSCSSYSSYQGAIKLQQDLNNAKLVISMFLFCCYSQRACFWRKKGKSNFLWKERIKKERKFFIFFPKLISFDSYWK